MHVCARAYAAVQGSIASNHFEALSMCAQKHDQNRGQQHQRTAGERVSLLWYDKSSNDTARYAETLRKLVIDGAPISVVAWWPNRVEALQGSL